ncbi:ComEA family DNA-binding protein [Paucisalibacillus globulus]|uniref:ComEA family DNA-binding protein n=1 Tax=Paucisalibacillus globulus TaxID=351095 RepID=UPI000A06E216|nr:ComEA family DNA-binding protein [Paucisalibacillus globulus]
MIRRNIFVILIGIGVLIAFFFVMKKEEEPAQAVFQGSPETFAEGESEKEDVQGRLLVDIKGEVRLPGVYEMDAGARVKDVVKEAGGFTEEADHHLINLAQKVFDEMILIVPKIGDESSANEVVAESSKIRINYATAEEIQQLPGIGPSKANAILEYREEHGFFQKPEDLLNVSGIGKKTLETLLEEIQIP